MNWRYQSWICLLLALALINSCKEDEPTKPWNATWTATNVTSLSATLNGAVNANQVTTTVSFEYGSDADYGNTIAATPNTVTGQWDVNVNADITNLLPATTYHFRIKSENSKVAVYGSDLILITAPGKAPVVQTIDRTNVNLTEVTVYGTVNPNLAPTTVTFEYGATTNYSSTVNATQNPLTGDSTKNVSATITGLTFGQTYHFRIKAENPSGSAVGKDLVFIPYHPFGSSFQGGLLAYVFHPGDPGYEDNNPHGLIVGPDDLGGGGYWSLTHDVIGASEVTIGSGKRNTDKIVAFYNDPRFAANLCQDLVLNGFDDWFLPSLNELKALNTFRFSLGLNNNYRGYWSSSEYTPAPNWYAWGFYYSGLGEVWSIEKTNGEYIRPMRYF